MLFLYLPLKSAQHICAGCLIYVTLNLLDNLLVYVPNMQLKLYALSFEFSLWTILTERLSEIRGQEHCQK